MNLRQSVLALLLWLLLWQLISISVNNTILLAGPWETAEALLRLFGSSAYWSSVLHSLLRILGGFLAGGLLGVLLAAAAYSNQGLRIILSPFVASIRAIPVVSFVILLLIWSGSGGVAFWISAIVSFPVLYLNSLAGLMSTEHALIEVTELFQLRLRDRISALYLPQLKPFLRGALSIAAGMSFKAGVAAEVIGQPMLSIGNGMYRAKIYLETAELFAWTLTVVLLSWLLERMLLLLLRKC